MTATERSSLGFLVLCLVTTVHCGTSSPGSGAQAGAGGVTSGGGGPSTGGATSSGGASGGSVSTGGTSGSGGTGGKTSSGGTGGSIVVHPGSWTDVSPPSSGKKVSAVGVNRLTGDVYADVNDGGVYKSTDQAQTWTRVDNGAVGGLAVTGPAFDVDQTTPTRMAAWSLDGSAGWTDGTAWKKMAPMGRNWDFGGTDWSSATPKTMIGALHESGGQVYVSKDGAVTWSKLSITVLASGGGWPVPAFAMVGVIDATTLVYSNGAGIYRSTDTGASFALVSPLKPQTRVPVVFKGSVYLGGTQGLIVSADKGATWQLQGAQRFMWVGPYFGADEKSMVVADSKSIYETNDAGTTWTKIASLPSDAKYDTEVWGGVAWDPINNIVYAATTGLPLMKMKL